MSEVQQRPLEQKQAEEVEYRDLTVLGLPGYRVGSDGSVWSNKARGGRERKQTNEWRRLKQCPKRNGYMQVTLTKGRQELVHRLVLLAFVGPCPRGMQCRHFPDPNKGNCTLENLSWGTPEQNADDKRKHGSHVAGERMGLSKLTDEDVRIAHKRKGAGETLISIAADLDVSPTTIGNAVRGRTWSHVV